ncbi:MAG: MBL fold metallo-hydrolase [Sedimentibacter sp.]|uniref:MBL fold metallo-hydrolase n=1 Tax=Sedimentibacter sp. TaxID=1960295 RepID=UPI0029819377|nr:MBL fold metallo-hydrolase [Sedimentibacter sp.]MDW5300291.1 MBL fold metallo-hydrolase [Sedimentibacter sp.]
MMKLKLTTLIEDNIDDAKKLINEHGLSLYIEVDGKNILFDTGQTGDFIKNAKSLNKNLGCIDYIIISHGHYDHSGGFRKLINELNNKVEVIVGAEFFNKKYKLLDVQTYKYIGNSFDENYILEKCIPLKKIEDNVHYISENLMLFHHFERKTDFEIRNDKFFIDDENVKIHDEFEDEIVLGISTKKGLVVVVGCSHVGIINILNSIKEKTGMPIYAVIGGTHLVEANEIRMKKTIEELHKFNLSLIGVSHCTGEEGIKRIKEEFEDTYIYNNTGNVIEIDDEA